MTPSDHDIDRESAAAMPADKVLDHTRLQLSALIDGELPLDEARFLLRRLDHDAELRDCWERWQLCGDVMRGRVGGRAREGLAAQVSDAVAGVSGVLRESPARDRRWWRWGSGAALAASVAMIAMFMTRQSPDVRRPVAERPAQVASNPAPMPVETPVGTHVPPPVAANPAPAAPNRAAEVASALAVADVPRRVAARRSRSQGQRAALRLSTRSAAESPVAVAAAAPFATQGTVVDPFSGEHVRLSSRPWPRALLPGASAPGAFTVDYGSRMDVPATPFSPFGPRSHPLPVSPPDTGDVDAPRQ